MRLSVVPFLYPAHGRNCHAKVKDTDPSFLLRPAYRLLGTGSERIVWERSNQRLIHPLPLVAGVFLHHLSGRIDAPMQLHRWARFTKKYQFLYLLVIICAYTPHECHAIEMVAVDTCVFIAESPDWVSRIKPLCPDGRVNDFSSSHLSYELVNTQVNLDSDTVKHYHESWIVPLSPEGLSEAGEVQILYNPAFQKLFLHEIKIKRGRKIIDRLNARNINLLRREQDLDYQLYNGLMTASAPISGLRVRDTVIYSYTLSGTNPVFEDNYSSTFSLGWSVYVGRTYVRLICSPKRKLYYETINTDKPPRIINRKKSIEYVWDMQDLEPVAYEYGAPVWYNPYPHVQVTHYSSWKDVCSWALKLYDQEDSLTAEMIQSIEEWKQETDSQNVLAVRALDFTQQQIRYLGMELGINSHLPAAPATVLERRFGDCKDKSLLLTAILKRCGIKAYPALVSHQSGKTINDRLPSPQIFDHVIVMAEIGDEKMWMDPTEQYQKGPISQRYLGDFSYALVVKRNQRKLTPIDTRRPSAQVVEEHYYVDSYESPVRLEITTTFRGAQAEAHRAIFSTQSLQEIGKHNLNFYARLYAGIEQQKQVVGIDDRNRNIFTTREWYTIPDFWERKKGRLFCDLQGSIIEGYVSLPGTIKRTMPLAIAYPFEAAQKKYLHYPTDVPLDMAVADSAIVDHAAFRYTLAAHYKDSTLSVVYDYRNKKSTIDPDDMAGYVAALQDVNKQINYRSWIPYSDTAEIRKLFHSLSRQIDSLTGFHKERKIKPRVNRSKKKDYPLKSHAEIITQALNRKDVSFLNQHFDTAGFVKEIRELPLSPLAEIILGGNTDLFSNIWADIIGQSTDSSTFRFVNVKKDSNQVRYLFRRDFKGGSNMHFEIYAAAADTPLITDWYAHSIGISHRTKLKQVLTTILGKVPQTGPDSAQSQSRFLQDPVIQLIENMKTGSFEAARDAFDRIDPEEKRNPLIIAYGILIGRHLGRTDYDDIMEYIADEFGPESRYSYLLLPHFIAKEDFKQADAALKDVKKKMGKDPSIICYQAEIDVGRKDYNAAMINARDAILLDSDYEPSYWLLLEILVNRNLFKQAVLVLDLLVLNFQYYIDTPHLETMKGYKEFVRSPHFKRWKSSIQ